MESALTIFAAKNSPVLIFSTIISINELISPMTRKNRSRIKILDYSGIIFFENALNLIKMMTEHTFKNFSEGTTTQSFAHLIAAFQNNLVLGQHLVL
jgi:hypothetical protein